MERPEVGADANRRWMSIQQSGFALGGIRMMARMIGCRKGEAGDAWDCGFINRLYADGMFSV